MRNLKSIMIILLTGLFAVGFFSSCAEADTGYTDEELAVLVNRAVSTGGTASVEGSINSTEDAVFTGSQFNGEINGWTGTTTLFTLSYSNLNITVQDDNGNNITVVLNGSIAYGYNVAPDPDNSITMVMFGTISGSVDGESFSLIMDLKTSISSDMSTFTITGTINGVTINETY